MSERYSDLDGRLVTPANENAVELIDSRERLGEWLCYYHREAT